MSAAIKKSPKAGRPPSEFEGRYYLRRHDDEEASWRIAAATCGMSIGDWMRSTLNAEAAKATHVPLLKRAK